MTTKTFESDAIPVASDETKQGYLREGRRIVAMAEQLYPNYPDEPLRALRSLFYARPLAYRHSTTRAFKQQAFAIIDCEVARGAVAASDAEYQRALMSALLKKCRGQPEPRTSAKKVEDPSVDEYYAITAELNSADRNDLIYEVLRSMVVVSPYTGLRPCEWLNATFANGRLKITNAKSTNGRAPGEFRTINLRNLPKKIVDATVYLTKTMSGLLRSHGGHWRKLLKILAERLARACKRIGIRRLSLYTLRHAAIATWQRAGLAPAQIAALAGHASLKTAKQHYAGARHGWSPDFAVAEPSMSTVHWILDRAEKRSAPPPQPLQVDNPPSPEELPRPETSKPVVEPIVASPVVGLSAAEEDPAEEEAWVPQMR